MNYKRDKFLIGTSFIIAFILVSLDLVDGDEEEAELYWQHLQQIIIVNEIAVKSAADAVYGIGTKYADALYKEILQTGKTIGVYFKEF